MSVSFILDGGLQENFAQAQQVFDRWAKVYDDQLNPLLSLEQRFLQRMIPDARDLHVLDAGCGTGRWLSMLAKQSPRSLIGVDLSEEMLRHAAAKFIPNVDLRPGSCTSLPVQDSIIDLVLCSFLLSHIEDIHSVIKDLSRVTAPEADIFITDMHPETAGVHSWKRSFCTDGNDIELQTCNRALNEIAECFQKYGFRVRALIEPDFGKPEQELFQQSGREKAYQAVEKLPAIYILQLSKSANSSSQSVSHQLFANAQAVLGGDAIYLSGKKASRVNH